MKRPTILAKIAQSGATEANLWSREAAKLSGKAYICIQINPKEKKSLAAPPLRASKSPADIMKTSTKIFAIIIPTTAAAILCAGFFNYRAVTDEQRAEAEAHMNEMSDLSAREISSSLKAIRDELTWIAQHPKVQTMRWDDMSEYLDEMASRSTERFTNLMMIEPNGDYYFAGQGRIEGRNLSDRKYFREIMHESARFAITSPDYSKLTGQMKYTLAVPIHAEGGPARGCLASNISLDILSGMVSEGNEAGERIRWVVDERGYVIGSADRELLLKYNLRDEAANCEGMESVVAAIDGRVRSSVYVNLFGGHRYFATCQPIGGTPGWALVSAISEKSLTSLAQGMMWRTIAALGISIIIIVIAVEYVLHEEISKDEADERKEMLKATKGK